MKEKISLQDLSALLSERAEITKKEAETFLREYFEVMNEDLIKSGLIKIKDLGAFKLSIVENRESIDVTTGERVLIPSHYKVIFTPDKKLAETVNEPFDFFETTEIEDEEEEKEEIGEIGEIEEAVSEEPVIEEEDEIILEEPIVEEEDEIILEEPIVEEEEIVLEEPVIEEKEEENPKQSVRNDGKDCSDCRDFKSYYTYRKKYFKAQKKLKCQMLVIYTLFTLLLGALGYIIYFELKISSILKVF